MITHPLLTHKPKYKISIGAIWAARHKKRYGRYSTMRFCINHNIPIGLYRLACQLEATIKFNEIYYAYYKNT